MNRYRFGPEDPETGRVELFDMTGSAVCWLPGTAAMIIAAAYLHQVQANAMVANRWMEGVLFGIHLSLAFGNQLPKIEMETVNGQATFRMVDDAG